MDFGFALMEVFALAVLLSLLSRQGRTEHQRTCELELCASCRRQFVLRSTQSSTRRSCACTRSPASDRRRRRAS